MSPSLRVKRVNKKKESIGHIEVGFSCQNASFLSNASPHDLYDLNDINEKT